MFKNLSGRTEALFMKSYRRRYNEKGNNRNIPYKFITVKGSEYPFDCEFID